MLTKNQIDEISNFIYKMPDAFYECQKHLDEGDITAAMELLRGSETFKAYFATIVNLGDFGAQNHTRDIYAMAYPLGIDNLKMIICSYFVFIKSPKRYKNFGVNLHSMMEFNAKFLSELEQTFKLSWAKKSKKFVSSCLRANFAYILRADLFEVSTLA